MKLYHKLRLPILILLAMLLLTSATIVSTNVSDWIVKHDQRLRETIHTRPTLSLACGFFLYLVLSLIPGTAGKSIVVGWFFGVLRGMLIVNISMTIAAIATFTAARYLLKDAVLARWGRYMGPLNAHLAGDGATYLLTLRLAHAPFTILNYAAGAVTPVPLRTFWWTTQLGLLPGNFVFVFAGTRLPSLNELMDRGPLALADPWMMTALAATVCIPWLTRLLLQYRKRRNHA